MVDQQSEAPAGAGGLRPENLPGGMEMHAAVVKVAPHNIPVLHGQKLLTFPSFLRYPLDGMTHPVSLQRERTTSLVSTRQEV